MENRTPISHLAKAGATKNPGTNTNSKDTEQINPIALRTAKTPYSFGHSEWNRINLSEKQPDLALIKFFMNFLIMLQLHAIRRYVGIFSLPHDVHT